MQLQDEIQGARHAARCVEACQCVLFSCPWCQKEPCLLQFDLSEIQAYFNLLHTYQESLLAIIQNPSAESDR